jgi:hypothetical protein
MVDMAGLARKREEAAALDSHTMISILFIKHIIHHVPGHLDPVGVL